MFVEKIQRWGDAHFNAPATADAIQSCEAKLGHGLPEELRRLLAESNGIEGEYGLGLLWTTKRIAEDNARFRDNSDLGRLCLPFDELMFFSDAGNGDQFAVFLGGDHGIYVWNHENDGRVWVAPTVMRFLEDWMTGKLKI